MNEVNYSSLQEQIERLEQELNLEKQRNREIESRFNELYEEKRRIEEYIQDCTKYKSLSNLYLKLRKAISEYYVIREIKKSGRFNEEYYLQEYPYIANRSKDLVSDYVRYGSKQGLNPEVRFNTRYYLASNQDVRRSYINPLYHYIKYGIYEARRPHENADMYLEWCENQKHKNKYIRFFYDLKNGYTIYKSGLFDGEFYLQSNPDVKEKVVNNKLWGLRNNKNKLIRLVGRLMTSAITHYVRYGVYEGRNPNATFNTSYYINNNLDILREKHVNPFAHYVKYGIKERRRIRTEEQNLERQLLRDTMKYIEGHKEEIAKYEVGIIVPPTQNKTDISKYVELICKQNFVQYKIVFLDFEEDLEVTKEINDFIIQSEKESKRIHISKEDWNKDNWYIQAFQSVKMDIIWMPSLEGHYKENFLSKLVTYFIDPIVKAVIYKNLDGTENYVEIGDLDYAITGQMAVEGLLLGQEELYKLVDTLFRNPINEEWLIGKEWKLRNVNTFRHFMLRMLLLGKVVHTYGIYREEKFVETESKKTIEVFDTYEKCKQHETLLGDLKEFYNVSPQQLKNEYEKVRTSYIGTSSESIDYFTKIYDINAIMRRKSRPRIMISIIAFTHGGGEIMPIRLANQLYEMGYEVMVHNYHYEEDEPKIRKMLNINIPVVETNQSEELVKLLRVYGIDVISTHHQALQSLVAKALEQDEMLRDKINHVATSHGMYENFEENIQKIIFKQLEGKVDYWTYVADKNLIPFKNFNIYDKEKFIKIPNGMKTPEIVKMDRKTLGINEDAFVICTVSRALKEKGWKDTIKSVKIARETTGRDIQLLLIGDGPVYEELSQSGVEDYVNLLGFKENPCDYYGISDLAMLTSYYKSESAPLTIIEALFSGLPVIATNIGDIKQMLSVGEELAGDIFDLTDGKVPVEIVSEKLVTLMQNPEVYKHKVQLAIQKSKTFDIENVAKKYIEVFLKKMDYEEIFKSCIEEIEKSNLLLSNSERKYHSLKVSVIVPNYNHEKFLRQRLDCIYKQTYKNIEVILMDDCSKDSSREILSEYAQKYPDITKVIFNDTNSGGVFYQWTKGVKNATGDICWIAESDDYCDLNFIEKLIPAFEDAKVRISYCKYMFVNTKGEQNPYGFAGYVGEIDKDKWTTSYVADIKNEVNSALAIKNTIPNASGALFRRPLEMKLFDDNAWLKMKICGDWIFYLHLLKDGKIAYNVETQSYFRFHDNNSSADTYSKDIYYKEHAMVATTIKDLYDVDSEALQKNYDLIKAFYFEHVKGTEMDFNKLYDLKNILARKKKLNPVIRVKEQQMIGEEVETIIINPIFSAGTNLDSSLEEKFEYVGNNTGNLLFAESLKEQLNYSKETWIMPESLADEKNISAVMPSSNFIIHGGDEFILQCINLLEGTTCPITLAGLGAQSTKELNTPKKLVKVLSPARLKYFKMISERATSIGVRGEFTAQCLEEMGIHNYRIIGCPSAYKYLDGVYKKLKKPSAERVMFTVTTGNEYERKILELGMKNQATWIMQMMTEMPEVVLEDKMPNSISMERGFPGLKVTPEELKAYMEQNAKVFFRIKEWYEYYEKAQFTFAFGTRFHGNMSALRCGIPALWIVHDSRTTELVNTLKLPHIDFKILDKVKTIEELMLYCDYEEFYKNYNALTKEYVQFLEENNLNHKFTLD